MPTTLQPTMETFDLSTQHSTHFSSNNNNNTTDTSTMLDQSLEMATKEELKYKLLMAKGFVQGALREYSQGDASRYNELIGQLTRKHHLPNAPSTVQLYVWVMTLSDCVSQLDKSCHELVLAVLQVDWSVRSDKFVDAFVRFIKNLVSAHSFYVVPVLNTIVAGFRFRYKMPPYSTTTRTVTYARHHDALQEIITLIPTASNSLYISLQRFIPYKQRNTADQAAFIKNMLAVMNYVPVLRKQLMALLVDHLIKIDAHIQIELDDINEDVEFDTYNMNFDEDYQSDNSDDDSDANDSDDIDNDDSDVDSDFGEDGSSNQKKQMNRVKSMVRRLDSLMQLVFTHFSQTLGDYDNNNNNNNNQLALASSSSSINIQTDMYNILLDSFDKTVLKTLRSRYTQFLLFYVCSLQSSFADNFLAHLFQHLTDPLKPNVTRIAAAAYISSYVARAKFMKPETIQQAIANLSDWCNLLLDQHETTLTLTSSISKHEVFYASVQAIMYIFCFRWRDLALHDDDDDDDDELVMEGINDQPKLMTTTTTTTTTGGTMMDHKKWCSGLRNIYRLLTSRLYPLKVCSTLVVRQFVKVAHQVNFMYLYPILEKSKDPLLSGVNVNVFSETGARNLLHTMQTFFPFDPYKLEGSKKFIEAIYFDWIPQDGQGDDSDSEEEDSDEEEHSDSDDMSAGTAAMSISPSPNHFL